MKFNEKDYEYMALAESLCKDSACTRNRVGAVFVRGGKVLITSANGKINDKIKSCDIFGGCLREKNHIKHGDQPGVCYAPCAETRCICEAARDGVALKGATVYATQRPCLVCTRNLIACEVACVIYKDDYPDAYSAAVAAAADLKVFQIK